MRLTTTDLNYIKHCMDSYDIKYQEVYDEINDHVISAVETARAGGDQRNIVPVFDELMESQFPGYWAFEKISKEYEKAYRKKIRFALWGYMKHYLSWQAILFISLSVIVGFYLPHDKRVSIVFMALMIIAAIVPYFYVLRKSNAIKTSEGKKSLVKNHIVARAFASMAITNILLNCIGLIGRDYNIHYLNPRYFHPVFYIILLFFFIIYGLSCVRLSRQEFRLTDSTN